MIADIRDAVIQNTMVKPRGLKICPAMPLKKASGRIGGKEVAIEAKESSIASLQKQLDKTTDEAKRQGLQEQITALELGIQSI